MCDEACALHAKQGRATIFRMIEALLEVGECAAREQISYLPCDGRSQRFFQSRAYQVRHAFGSLERDIADESVRHNDVDSAAVDVAAFDVADKIQRELLE